MSQQTDEDEALAARVAALKVLILTIVRALVNREDDVEVDLFHNGRHILASVYVADSDMPFALGTRGAYADMLRSIVIASCRKNRLKIELDVFAASERRAS